MAKKILPYFALIAAISGAFGYLYATFTPFTVHKALAEQVQKMDEKQYKRELKSELYYHYDLQRKYPNDPKITRKVKELEEELEELDH
jgi:hypothetical protein